MTSSGQPIEERVRELELEVDVLRSRNVKLPYQRWQVQIYVSIIVLVGLALGIWLTNGADMFIPELVNDAAPVLLVLGVFYYAFTRHEFKIADEKEPAPMTVAGNWYLASVALVALLIGIGLLLADKSRNSLEIALTADMIALVVFAAHPVTAIWRRHS